MDIQKIISDVLGKLKVDDNLKKNFLSSPVETVEKLVGVDLPNEKINEIVKGVMDKLNVDDVAKTAKGLLAKIKGFFSKKK